MIDRRWGERGVLSTGKNDWPKGETEQRKS